MLAEGGIPAFATGAAVAVIPQERSTADRYEALIRIANSIRARTEPRELFEILAHELGQVIQFDAIAQFDEQANKVNWHLGVGCQKVNRAPSEINREETLPAWVYAHQETVVMGTLDGETRFSASVPIMREAGLQSVC